MIKRKDMVKLEELEMLEEAELIDEYSYLDDLKKVIGQKDKVALDRLERKIENHESRLERYHKRVLETIKALKKEAFTRDITIVLDDIENEIGYYKQDLSRRISMGHKKFKRYVEEEMWDELGESIIEDLEKDIQIWFALDQKLIGLEEKLIKGEM